MKNKPKLFGIITLAVVIGFSMTACGGDDDGGGGGGGGTFTLTGIPAEYNGKYAFFMVSDGSYLVYGGRNINFFTNTGTLIPISNGKVSLPMWKVVDESGNAVRYSGNDTFKDSLVEILNTQTLSSDAEAIAMIFFTNVTFSKGNATRDWSQREE
jgi:hypothetical protein